MMEKFQTQSGSTNPQETSQPPQFLKEFSRENSQEERDAIASAIRERRRERDAWRAEHNARTEGKENLEAELETLRGQIDTYGSESFLRKIKDYFAYRNLKAQLAERAGSLKSAQNSVDAWQSEKPDFQEVHTLLNNFYEGEKKKWAEAGHTPEDIEQQFAEEHLTSLSVEDYALLMKRFPGEMLTHVTRQGIRDHVGIREHSAGAGQFHNNFKDILKDGNLRSWLSISLQEHSLDDALIKFMKIDDHDTRGSALLKFENKFIYHAGSTNAYPFSDTRAIHVAAEHVADGRYGAERGNEIFIAYPSVLVASQFNYTGNLINHKDNLIYTKDNEGMPLNVGLVFIPEDAQVDPETGSRYKIGEGGEPIVPKQRMGEVLKARFEKKGFVQTFMQQLPYRMNQVPKQEREALAEASFAEFGITDPDTKKALLDPRLIDKLADIWGKDDENGEYERILNEYFRQNAESPYELAEGTISSKEYWERYFQEHPTERPSKVIYYKGGDPSRALNEWREQNGIVKKTEDPTYGFAEHNVADSSDEANIGKDRFASLARKVIDDRFPERVEKSEQEKAYENPNDDPLIQEALKTIEERVNREYGAFARGEWGTIAQNEALSNRGGASRGGVELRHTNRVWDDFIDSHPDVAEKYRGKFQDIDNAFKRRKYRESAEQARLQNEATHASFDPTKTNVKIPEQESYVTTSPTESLLQSIEQAGLHTRVLKIENAEEFPEVILFEKEEIPTEKMVRVFRGINHLDSSSLEQIPYAMRAENGSSKPTALENMRKEVDALAHQPTYENLIAYAEKVRQFLNPREIERLDKSIEDIENGILDGYSTRRNLIFKQGLHNGGVADSGVTPYVSATFDPYEAIGYGRNGGLMVIDVPLSSFETLNLDGGELGLKGTLDKKYITAILPRKSSQKNPTRDETNHQLYEALKKVYESTDVPLYNDEELQSERKKKFLEQTEYEKEQQKIDAETIRQKRVEKLAKTFPELKINYQNALKESNEQKVDVYTKVKRDIFDHYRARLEKIGRYGSHIEDYDFSEYEYGGRKKFDRDSVTDSMLLKLRGLVDRLEEREKEREKSRNGK